MVVLSSRGSPPPGRPLKLYSSKRTEDSVKWRPIGLSSSFKLYASLSARRINSWAEEHGVVLPRPKGFRRHDGVYENNFLVESLLDDARAKRINLCLSFLDFSNAFGSVSHEVVLEGLVAAGAEAKLTAIIEDLYSDSSTTYLTSLVYPPAKFVEGESGRAAH